MRNQDLPTDNKKEMKEMTDVIPAALQTPISLVQPNSSATVTATFNTRGDPYTD